MTEIPNLEELPSPADDPAFRIWWHVLRPDRLQIAREIDRAARDYGRQDSDEAAVALSHIARWLRASAGEVGE